MCGASGPPLARARLICVCGAENNADPILARRDRVRGALKACDSLCSSGIVPQTMSSPICGTVSELRGDRVLCPKSVGDVFSLPHEAFALSYARKAPGTCAFPRSFLRKCTSTGSFCFLSTTTPSSRGGGRGKNTCRTVILISPNRRGICGRCPRKRRGRGRETDLWGALEIWRAGRGG